jgi:hypothetical protein
VGEGDIGADANVLERREGGIKLETRMRIREGGIEQTADVEIPEEERHGPSMQAR